MFSPDSITKQQEKIIRKTLLDIGETEKNREQTLRLLNEWIQWQPHLISLATVDQILLNFARASLCFADKEPECPFGSPEILLADVNNRCDRYWHCNDGLITNFFCPSGTGFEPLTDTCHTFASCLKNPTTVPRLATSVNSPASSTSRGALKEPSQKTQKPQHFRPEQENFDPQHGLNLLSAASRFLTPIIAPLLSQILRG